MSENSENENQFFDVDERRVFPRPLTPPMRFGRTDNSGMHSAIRVVVGILSIIALMMITFGTTNYAASFINPGLLVPAYGGALLVFSFAVFHVLRYISEND